MNKDKIIKCEIELERIFYPKGKYKVNTGEYAIFNAVITNELENCEQIYPKPFDYEKVIKLKGNVCKLEPDVTYKVCCNLAETHERYGNTYQILYINKIIDLSNKSKQRDFLEGILNPNTVAKLFDEYDDVITLLENNDIKALTVVKGIGIATAMRIIEEFNDSKDYSYIYTELKDLNLKPNFIKKVVDFYKSPDIVVDIIKNNPYKLVEISGIGFTKADEIAQASGLDCNDSRRIKACMMHILDTEGEKGRSYLHYGELLNALYNQLGHVEQTIINESAKDLINENLIHLSGENNEYVGLLKYYELEMQIYDELMRLKNSKGDKTFNIVNWEQSITKLEKTQGFKFTKEQYSTIKIGIDENVLGITGSAGCVDCDTEFFNGTEWKRIADYKHGEKVLQYHTNGKADLTIPKKYIKLPCTELYSMQNKSGSIDQLLSIDHDVAYLTSKGNLQKKSLAEIMQAHNNNTAGFTGRFLTHFKYDGDGLEITDEKLRVMVAVIADGTYMQNNSKYDCRFHLKKDRKKQRLRQILTDANIEYKESNSSAKDYVDIYINMPRKEKHFSTEWYNCSNRQMEIICDEVLHWDGCVKNGRDRFSSNNEKDINFIQFAFSSTGKRATISYNDRRDQEYTTNGKTYIRKSINWNIHISKHPYVSLKVRRKENKITIKKIKNIDGFKYCFTVETGFLVLRRNGKIFITGNCGKTTTMKGLVEVLKNYMLSACALSGKASLRITDATGLEASTICRLLGYRNGIFTFNEKNKLDTDVVFIDEGTMINGSIFLSVLKAIPNGAKLFILGDWQQLTPIGNCQVFTDILNGNIIPVSILTEIHRQAKASGIITLANMVINQQQVVDSKFEGSMILGELQDMELEVYKKDETPSDRVIKHFMKHYLKEKNIMNVQVISPMKKRGDLSCYNINNKIQSIINPINEDIDLYIENIIESKKTKKETIKKIYRMKIGDKVMNMKNNYRVMDLNGDETAVFNGNIGIIKSIETNVCIIDFEGIGEVIFNKKDFKNLELAYCCTTHKCVTDDTFIYTTKGLQQIKELNNGAEVGEFRNISNNIKVYNGTYLEQPKSFYNNGLDECKKITTKRRYQLTGTLNHGIDVLCANGYIERKNIEELTINDFIIINKNNEIYGDKVNIDIDINDCNFNIRTIIYKNPKKITNEFARFLGYMVGDGVISKDGIKFGKRHKEVVEDFKYCVQHVFGYDNANIKHIDGKTGGMYLIEISSKFISDFCKKIEGIQPNNKFVPKLILQTSKHFQQQFLKAYFEDGTINMKKTKNNERFDHIEIVSNTEILIKQIRMMLLNMGIISSYSYKYVKNKYHRHNLYLYKNDALIFKKEIGFTSKFKNERLNSISPKVSTTSKTTIPYITKIIKKLLLKYNVYDKYINNALRSAINAKKITYELLNKCLTSWNDIMKQDADYLYLKYIYDYTFVDKIINITKTIEQTYCLEMPETHKFIQNGINAWNCQGSQYKKVIVAMDNSAYLLLNAEQLYTALTRAKSHCILVIQLSALRKAINNREVKKKQTYLSKKLIKIKSSINCVNCVN